MKKSATPKKVPVTERALSQRIRRKLQQEHRTLRTARDDGPKHLGRYYVVDIHQHQIVDDHVDLEKMGRELKVLAEWEEVSK